MSRQTISRTKALIFSLVLAALVFAAAESVLRVYWPLEYSYQFPEQNPQRDQSQFYDPDPELFWRLKPGARLFAEADPINEAGYRGPLLIEQKPDRTMRIVILGDSCTFGMSVPLIDTYSMVAGRLLNQRAVDLRVEVLNGGVPGYTSFQALASLQRDLIGYDPDLVTIYCGWNDANPAAFLPDQKQSPMRIKARPIKEFFGQSRIYHDLADLLTKRPDFGPRVDIDAYRDNLLSLSRYLDQRGIELILITSPGVLLELRTNAVVRRIASERKATLLDLQLLMPWPRRPLFLEDGTHPNAEGNRLIGRLLADKVCAIFESLNCRAADPTDADLPALR